MADPDKLKAAFAEIDAGWRAARAPKPRGVALARFIAHHRQSARIVIGQAKARRKWLGELNTHNPGASRFYSDHADIAIRTAQMHRAHVNRARRELRALLNDQQKAA